MERRIYNKHLFLGTIILGLMQLLIIVLLFAILLNLPKVEATPIVVEEPSTPAVEVEEYKEVEAETKTEVMFTNYYPNDKTGSTHSTGSGLTTENFEINELGWYTYKGRVVVATATDKCVESNYKGCDLYNEYEEGITYYTYGDELEIEFNGVRYEAVVLDSCGSSHDKEWLKENAKGLNLIDIYMVSEKYAFGKVTGYVIE